MKTEIRTSALWAAAAMLVLLTVAARAQSMSAAGGYGDTLYPYVHEYDQILVYKIAVDYCPANPMPPLDAARTLDVIRRIDNITRGIPKIVYLVGWQYRGHDTGYPALDRDNEHLKRPEDATALDSLRWLMREGPKHHTLVSLHVNFSDCYLDDNALGPHYKERDIIVRNGDGTHRQGYTWCDHMAYRASNFRNWYQDTFKDKQIGPLFAMIPELAASGTLHPDAWYSIDDPYYGITDAQDCEAMRQMTLYVRRTYNVDLTTEFDRRRPPNTDFVLYHPLLWHIAWDERTPPDPMKIPPYFLAGVNAKTWSNSAETVQSKFFGEGSPFESEVGDDPAAIRGGLKSFATRALGWYYLNRRLRVTFDGQTATFSDGVTTSYPGRYVMKAGGDFLQDGDDVFIPALWRANREIVAYSSRGYAERTWTLPKAWSAVKAVDAYRITMEGLAPGPKGLKVSPDGKLRLSLPAGEGLSLVPAGADPNADPPPVPSGTVAFLGEDNATKGAWKGRYGADGYVVVGAGESLPPSVKVAYINGAERVWNPGTADVQALEKPAGEDRIAASRLTPLHEIVDVSFPDAKAHDVSLYVMDWDRAGRWTTVDAIDSGSRR
ncbi:MAG: endo-alpha-N-acetylgalactosaminidase family protein, partial [Candidatus Aminicenantales bacterium]